MVRIPEWSKKISTRLLFESNSSEIIRLMFFEVNWSSEFGHAETVERMVLLSKNFHPNFFFFVAYINFNDHWNLYKQRKKKKFGWKFLLNKTIRSTVSAWPNSLLQFTSKNINRIISEELLSNKGRVEFFLIIPGFEPLTSRSLANCTAHLVIKPYC